MIVLSVEPIIFFFVFCNAAQMFLTQDYYFERLCMDAFPGSDVCFGPYINNATFTDSVSNMAEMKKVQSMVVLLWMGWNCIFVGTSIIMAQVFGYYMDKYSRKNVLLIPLVGQTMMTLCFVILTQFKSASVYLTFIAAFVLGSSGGFVVLKAACMSYLVQIIPSEEKRTSRFSVLEAAFFIGGSAGLFATKFLLNYLTDDYSDLFLIIMGASILNIIYAVFALPKLKSVAVETEILHTDPQYDQQSSESMESDKTNGSDYPPSKDNKSAVYKSSEISKLSQSSLTDVQNAFDKGAQSKSYQNSASSIMASQSYHGSGSFEEQHRYIISGGSSVFEATGVWSKMTNSLKTTFKKRNHGLRALIVANLIANGISIILMQVEIDLSYIYLKSQVDWSFGDFLQYFGIKTSTDGISLLIGLPLLRMLHISDPAIGVLGGLSRVAFYIYFAFVTTSNAVYWGMLTNIFGFYALVASKGIMSKLVPDTEQGRVLTVLSSWEQLSAVLGSLLFDSIFSELADKQLGFVTMLIAAGVGIIVVVLYCCLYFAFGIRRDVLASADERRSLIQPSNTH